jgi:hypothetical protein
VHVGRQVLEGKSEGLMDGLVFYQVVVIENQDNPGGEGRNLINQ